MAAIKITTAMLFGIAKVRPNMVLATDLSAELNAQLFHGGVDTPARVAMFLAQGCHETADFRTLVEYGSGDGPDEDTWDDYLTRMYDHRKDLGNTPEVDGDGERYRGRGFFQTTGATNYRLLSEKTGIDFLSHPEWLAEPRYAVEAAIYYWRSNDMERSADGGDVRTNTRILNGGYNGLADRERAHVAACKLLGIG